MTRQVVDPSKLLPDVKSALAESLCHMIESISPDDFTASELAAMYALVKPVFDREREPEHPSLRLVTNGGELRDLAT